jgi:hypothetical protein
MEPAKKCACFKEHKVYFRLFKTAWMEPNLGHSSQGPTSILSHFNIILLSTLKISRFPLPLYLRDQNIVLSPLCVLHAPPTYYLNTFNL